MSAKHSLLASKLKKAMAFQQSGNNQQAGLIYDEILAEHPRQFESLYFSGLIAAQDRRFGDATALLGTALEVDPSNAAAHYSMGMVLNAVDQLDAAIASYDRALARDPRFALAHFNRGIVLQRLNRLVEALDSYDRAIDIQPNYADAYFHRGKVQWDLDQLRASLASYDLAISHRPAFAAAYSNRAIVLSALGKHEAAIASLDRAIALNPRDARALFNRGATFKERNQLDDALRSYDQAIYLNPDFAEAYSNRGVVLKDLGQLDAAVLSFDRALALNASLPEAHLNKGNVLAAMGQVDAASAEFDAACALNGDLAKASFCRATTWLLAGDFERGWPAYESRWLRGSTVGAVMRKDFPTPPWLGGRSINEHTILLYAEQGLGDTLQFARYATLVAELGARVVLEVPISLKSLLASVEGVDRVVADSDGFADFEDHCPLMSLPLAFGTTLASIPAPGRYIDSDPSKRQFWQEKLNPELNRLKVGLVWSGGTRPNEPEAWATLNRRNIPLEQLACLRHPNIEFFSLQLGEPAAKDPVRLVANYWDGPAITDYTNLLRDFSDTAALVDNLDLVIAVDTSTAHLAAALGKPVWILNRYDTCWRWLLHRDDSPWYPSVKLYRQPSPGDWESVVNKVRSDLFRLRA